MEIERAVVGSSRCEGNGMEFKDGDIPEWFLVEVLIRLPAKFVCSFKVVSKQWFSIISDPLFIRTYVSRAILSSRSWTFIHANLHDKGSKCSHFLGYRLLEDKVLKPSLCELPLLERTQLSEDEFHEVLGVSSGLVLYMLLSPLGANSCLVRRHYICNPVTGHHIAFRALTGRLYTYGWGFITHVEDGFLKRYIVVRRSSVTATRGGTFIEFQVYFSEIDEWKKFIVSSDLGRRITIQKASTTLNGILHWIASEHGIIAYDPDQSPDRIHIIAFPGDKKNHQRRDILKTLCAAYQGKLRYFEVSGDEFPSFKVWVLNDYSSGDWCLQFDSIFPSESLNIIPISLHPFDSEIVYLRHDDVVVSYNMETRKLEVQEFFRHNGSMYKPFLASWTTFSLVIPPWPISIPHPSFGPAEG